MKKIQNLRNSSALFLFLNKIIGNKALSAVSNLAEYRIETVLQLLGIIHCRIPRVSEKTARIKGLTLAGVTARRKIHSERIVPQLQGAMKISKADAFRIYNRCIKMTVNSQPYNHNSGWAFGSVRSRKNKRIEDRFWFNAPNIKIRSGMFVVPGYNSIGPISDQGERGTCVAQAYCSLIDYLAELRTSSQFFYHQAKMVDGIPDEEGTYIESASRVLCDNSITDLGNIGDTVWSYNPIRGETPHQGPPPEKAFDTKRIYSMKDPVFIRENNKIEDIKYLLNYNAEANGRNTSHGKTSLVVVGLALFESFFSLNTSETGWITMPLPGEAIVGYHAMAICGYDDERRLFLVRNSWGRNWARNNDKGYYGHAWVPFEYMEQYCHVGVSVTAFKIEHMIIPESERLYNNVLISRYSGKRAAISKELKRTSCRSENRISFLGWLLRIAVIVFLLYSFQDQINILKVKLKDSIEEHVNTSELKNRFTELFEDFRN